MGARISCEFSRVIAQTRSDVLVSDWVERFVLGRARFTARDGRHPAHMSQSAFFPHRYLLWLGDSLTYIQHFLIRSYPSAFRAAAKL